MKLNNIFSKKNQILLRELVITDFKLRYQGSVLGYVWSLLKPLMLFTILYIVFIKFLRFGAGQEHFAVSLLLGIVLWTFFIEATSQGMVSIVARGDLIRKINFPKYIIVISGTISALINLVFNLAVVLAFVLLNGVDLKLTMLIAPINILELYLLALTVAFLLAAVYVKYHDISHIWEVFLQGVFYAIPIIYPVSMVMKFNPKIAKLLLLNPIAMIIQDTRYNIITHNTTTTYSIIHNPLIILLPYMLMILLAVLAVIYFKSQQRQFAENV